MMKLSSKKSEEQANSHDRHIRDDLRQIGDACDLLEAAGVGAVGAVGGIGAVGAVGATGGIGAATSCAWRTSLADLRVLYDLRAVPFLLPQEETRAESARMAEEAARKYFCVLEMENFDSRLEDVVTALTKAGNGASAKFSRNAWLNFCECLLRVKNNIAARNAVAATVAHASHPDDLVCCGERMSVSQDTSEAVCTRCMQIREIKGVLFRDEQISAQESSKSRRGGYVFVRHLRIWLDKLQGIESYVIGPEIIKAVKQSIIGASRSPVEWRTLSYADVARHVANCRLTRSVGEHIPKLMKLIGAPEPPILAYETAHTISVDFANIMGVYESLYCDQGNKPYYPFFIRKIIVCRFSARDDIEARKARRLLNYIEVQERDTVIKNDTIFKEICRAAPPEYDLHYAPEII